MSVKDPKPQSVEQVAAFAAMLREWAGRLESIREDMIAAQCESIAVPYNKDRERAIPIIEKWVSAARSSLLAQTLNGK